jgi:UDP-GlcNAc:undecaprenyl-phosphate/decaprenyl-phosphate GlcNAc-1-phosphate transferase
MNLIFILSGVLAFGLALYITPLTAKAASDLGIVAKPDGVLRTQEEAVPYLGGVAIYLSLLLALAVAANFSAMLVGLLLGTTIMLMVGMIDDFGVMTPKMKLLGQIIAAIALIKGGIYLELEIFKAIKWPADMPLLSWGLSIVWLVGIANAINFLDIEDGLAGGTAAFCLPALIVVAFLNGRADEAIFTIALLGAVMGFLRYNAPFPKARIYLGDAGSLFLGMALAALAMTGSYTENNNIGAICPVLILGVPCFEMGITMAARFRKRIPVWQGSPDHIAKRLQVAGYRKKTVIIMHWSASLFLGGLAVFIMKTDIIKAAIAFGILVVVSCVIAFLLLRIEIKIPAVLKEEGLDES